MVIDLIKSIALNNIVMRKKKQETYILKTKRKMDLIFKLICNTRRRIHRAVKGKSKPSTTVDILGIDIDIYRKWIDLQMTPEMN